MMQIRSGPTNQSPPQATQRRARILIIDPARRLHSERDQEFSDYLARAFFGVGFEVVWVVDRDDPLPEPPYARVQRLLPHAQDGAPAGATLPASRQRPIERLDCWARAIWKSVHAGRLAKAAALLAWISIRLAYRGEYAVALAAWWGVRSARALERATGRTLGRSAHVGRWGLWSIAYPFLRLSARISGGRRKNSAAPARAVFDQVSIAVDSQSADAQVARLIAALGEGDAVILPSADLRQMEWPLQFLPYMGLSSPLPTTLHVRFTAEGAAAMPTREEAAMLVARLRSGSPIRTTVLHAGTAELCRALEASLGLTVQEWGDGDRAVLHRRFAPAGETLDVPSSLVVSRFGPVALLISALWGRVGSSTIFDAQTRYLLERGFIIARILIDHYPQTGPGRLECLEGRLAENFEKVRPHLHFVAERREGFGHLWQLHASDAFRESSPVGRMGMLLADARVDQPAAVAWCADHAAVAVVNHLPHVAFAERLTKAPIVLETHDIFAMLLKTHGIPDFVPRGPDRDDLREAEEAAVWRRVGACINLSPDDHAVVARAARHSALVRPYVDRIQGTNRSWAEVVAANRLPAVFHELTSFDIMLWGDWHEGNVAGVRWFLEQVVPRHAALEQASILLAGRVVRGLPRRLLQRPGLHTVGFVDCIDDFFARSTVLGIPDRPGSTGASLKALDALAGGCCFASTAAGLRGVTLGDTGLMPSDDPAALALDIAGLLQSPDARRARASLARRLYELNFSIAAYSQGWDTVLGAVPRFLDHRCTRPRPQPLDRIAAAS